MKPALVFDEGGGILRNAFPGVKNDTAFLGVVEKGMVNIKLSLDNITTSSNANKELSKVKYRWNKQIDIQIVITCV